MLTYYKILFVLVFSLFYLNKLIFIKLSYCNSSLTEGFVKRNLLGVFQLVPPKWTLTSNVVKDAGCEAKRAMAFLSGLKAAYDSVGSEITKAFDSSHNSLTEQREQDLGIVPPPVPLGGISTPPGADEVAYSNSTS